MASTTLVDTIPFQLELHENTDTGKTFARGVFALAESPTANGRVYPGKLWERETGKLRRKMENRSLFGLLDHPSDGKTSLKEASHLITSLTYNGSEVRGEAEILPTPTGQILKALIEAGATVGISSRGVGSTQRDAQGKQLVQDDYQLLSFDFVADPAAATAWPEFKTEDHEHQKGAIMEMTRERLEAEHGDLIKEIIKEATKGLYTQADLDTRLTQGQQDIEQKLVAMVSEQRETAMEQARSEALSDPKTAGANLVLESVVSLLRPFMLDEHTEQLVKAKDGQIKQLGEDLEAERQKNTEAQQTLNELMLKIEDVSRRYYMARNLNILEDEAVTGRIFSLVGDPSRFENTDKFKEAFQAAVRQAQADDERAQNENEEIARLEDELAKANEALSKSIALGEALGARAYAEKRLNGHPHAPALRSMMEESNPSNNAQVDALIESWNENNPPSSEFTDVLGAMGGDPPTELAGGISHLQEGLEDIGTAVLPGDNGVSQQYGPFDDTLMEELKQLSGIPGDNGDGNNGGMPY